MLGTIELWYILISYESRRIKCTVETRRLYNLFHIFVMLANHIYFLLLIYVFMLYIVNIIVFTIDYLSKLYSLIFRLFLNHLIFSLL